MEKFVMMRSLYRSIGRRSLGFSTASAAASTHRHLHSSSSSFLTSPRRLSHEFQHSLAMGTVSKRFFSEDVNRMPDVKDPEIEQVIKDIITASWDEIPDEVAHDAKKALSKSTDDKAGQEALANAFRAAEAVEKFSGRLNSLKMKIDDSIALSGEDVKPLPEEYVNAFHAISKQYFIYLMTFDPNEGYLKKKVENELGTRLIYLEMRCSGLSSEWGKIVHLDGSKSKSSGSKGLVKKGGKDEKPDPQVFWAPTPLNAKSWADVDDEDDDDYYATPPPPQAAWDADDDSKAKGSISAVEANPDAKSMTNKEIHNWPEIAKLCGRDRATGEGVETFDKGAEAMADEEISTHSIQSSKGKGIPSTSSARKVQEPSKKTNKDALANAIQEVASTVKQYFESKKKKEDTRPTAMMIYEVVSKVEGLTENEIFRSTQRLMHDNIEEFDLLQGLPYDQKKRWIRFLLNN